MVDERYLRHGRDQGVVRQRRRRHGTQAQGRDDRGRRHAPLSCALRARCEAHQWTQLPKQSRRHDHRPRHRPHVGPSAERRGELAGRAHVCGKPHPRRIQRLAFAQHQGTPDAHRLYVDDRHHRRGCRSAPQSRAVSHGHHPCHGLLVVHCTARRRQRRAYECVAGRVWREQRGPRGERSAPRGAGPDQL